MEKLKFEYEERIRLETLERDERIRAEKAEPSFQLLFRSRKP